jgi:undecaprenyl-diphosphatase
MDIIQALILGIVQGLTEFLPISSSAHLIIVPLLLGWPQPGLAFDMALHLGTLVAVLSYFRRDLLAMAVALPRGLMTGRPLADLQSRLALFILLGSLPAGVAGLVFQRAIEATFYTDEGLSQSLIVIAFTMIGLALLLALAERLASHRRDLKDLRPIDALVIGIAQAVALVPGVSRSGSTITAGLFAGLTRAAAARYSFLLGTPIILLAALKQIYDVVRAGFPTGEIVPFAAGFITSSIVGYLCIKYLLRYLQVRTMTVFVVYRLFLGLGLLVFILVR